MNVCVSSANCNVKDLLKWSYKVVQSGTIDLWKQLSEKQETTTAVIEVAAASVCGNEGHKNRRKFTI